MSDFEEEEVDYSKAVTFSDSETEDQSKTTVVEVSERTEKYLQETESVKLRAEGSAGQIPTP